MAAKLIWALRESSPRFGAGLFREDAIAGGTAYVRADIADDLLSALKKLSAEVGGMMTFEAGVRAAIGNTNWSVLELRLSEAEAAIAKAETA